MIVNTSGVDIDYWDVNFMRVWNAATNTFSDGKIEKLFASLPEDVSIGNPAYAKNSPYIIAFDYVDYYFDEYFVYAVNVETGVVNEVVQNSILGFPSYSRLDDKLAFSAENLAGEPVVAVIPLQADKITAGGQATILVNDAKWPVYYSTGVRAVSIPEISTATTFSLYPNPAQHKVVLQWAGEMPQNATVSIYNYLGQEIKQVRYPALPPALEIDISGLPAGAYVVMIRTEKGVASERLVVQ